MPASCLEEGEFEIVDGIVVVSGSRGRKRKSCCSGRFRKSLTINLFAAAFEVGMPRIFEFGLDMEIFPMPTIRVAVLPIPGGPSSKYGTG